MSTLKKTVGTVFRNNIESNFKEHDVIVESVWQIKEGGGKNVFIAG